ncbi:MAG: HugZ family protein [Pseudomonadota bacterium]
MNGQGDERTDPAALAGRLHDFIAAQTALVLAVDDFEGGPPVIGTLPFVHHDGRFCVLASELAPHTQAMRRADAVSVALMADQCDIRNPFARERAQWQATVEAVERKSEAFEHITGSLRERHGKTVDLLCGLGDFHLLCLRPGNGRYVNGFGRAFRLAGLVPDEQITG